MRAQVVDKKESRLAKIQRAALAAGRSSQLSWQYDSRDEMIGAWCDGVFFDRAELLSLSTL